MKSIWFFIAFSLLLIDKSIAQAKKIKPESSTIFFVIKNAGISMDGSFGGLKGKIIFNPEKPAETLLDVSIESKTVVTGNNTRDNHLRKEEYFNVKKYPEINFRSKKTEKTTDGYITTGDLTIKGKTKEIKIPFTYSEVQKTGTFRGSFTINRLDYEVGNSSWILSNDVTINLNIEVELP
jgi:polyisoprenoid-binding protein YceI